jgi:hypothetical protein
MISILCLPARTVRRRRAFQPTATVTWRLLDKVLVEYAARLLSYSATNLAAIGMLQPQRREANLNFTPSGNRSARSCWQSSSGAGCTRLLRGWPGRCLTRIACKRAAGGGRIFCWKVGNETYARGASGPIPERPSYSALRIRAIRFTNCHKRKAILPKIFVQKVQPESPLSASRSGPAVLEQLSDGTTTFRSNPAGTFMSLLHWSGLAASS